MSESTATTAFQFPGQDLGVEWAVGLTASGTAMAALGWFIEEAWLKLAGVLSVGSGLYLFFAKFYHWWNLSPEEKLKVAQTLAKSNLHAGSTFLEDGLDSVTSSIASAAGLVLPTKATHFLGLDTESEHYQKDKDGKVILDKEGNPAHASSDCSVKWTWSLLIPIYGPMMLEKSAYCKVAKATE
jgi:hypothetical protein